MSGPASLFMGSSTALDAKDQAFGIAGDGVRDDTRPVQAFLDHCAEQKRIADFGAMRLRVSGPIIARCGVMFDRNAYGGDDDPGFHPVGSGYTVLTFQGIIPCCRVAVSVSGPRRPRLNGIQFGGDMAAQRHLAMSNIDYVRVDNLDGFGVRIEGVFDSIFHHISIERCGNADSHAFIVADGNLAAGQTTNETVFGQVQVELSEARAVYVSPNTLSCTFLKLHSERSTVRGDDPCWHLGGVATYANVRLHAEGRQSRCVIEGQQTVFTAFRSENVTTLVNATGGTIGFQEASGVFAANPGQNGRVTFNGGTFSIDGATSGWTMRDAVITRLLVANSPEAGNVVADNCSIGMVGPTADCPNGRITLRGGRIGEIGWRAGAAGSLAEVVATGGAVIAPKSRKFTLAGAVLRLDAARFVGDLTVNGGALCLANGAIVDGNLVIAGPAQSMADPTSGVTGQVTGWTYPRISNLIPIVRGLQCWNIAARAGEPMGWVCVKGGGQPEWRPMPSI